MAGHRLGRLSEDIKRELARLIREEVKDPRIGFVSITGIDIPNDLKQAKVYVSVLGDEDRKAATLATLKQAAGYLRKELARTIKARTVPELLFNLDESIARGARITELLNEVKQQEQDTAEQQKES